MKIATALLFLGQAALAREVTVRLDAPAELVRNFISALQVAVTYDHGFKSAIVFQPEELQKGSAELFVDDSRRGVSCDYVWSLWVSPELIVPPGVSARGIRGSCDASGREMTIRPADYWLEPVVISVPAGVLSAHRAVELRVFADIVGAERYLPSLNFVVKRDENLSAQVVNAYVLRRGNVKLRAQTIWSLEDGGSESRQLMGNGLRLEIQ
jgi:hypothetical protein